MISVRIGIANDAEIRKMVLGIASGRLKSTGGVPKIWVRSVAELKTLLSDKNMHLLACIRREQPESISALAKAINLDQGNLTKKIKQLSAFGLVCLEETESKRGRKSLKPSVPFDRIIPPTIDLEQIPHR